MKKSISVTEHFCPETLFVYGTTKEDGTPGFGLFCWFSHYFDKEMGVMASFGGEKLTRDRIKANKIFSANLVTEELLPAADYFGNTSGYDADKTTVHVDVERGQVLDVPILARSPLVYELEVAQSIELDGGAVVLCKIKNVLADELMADDTLSLEQRMKSIRPIQAVQQEYFQWDGVSAGKWCEPMKNIKRKESEMK